MIISNIGVVKSFADDLNLVGKLAFRKARNLEQVGGSGDGIISAPAGNTLETIAGISSPASAEEKRPTENVTSGWPGELGTRRARRNLSEEEAAEGSDRREG
jgi:hypothetical protein